ncbi:peptidase C65 Otubain-domain-containing protein [Microdochium trichocladiopsis]|uniref:ubiquitinyl hydrolase 1 n=1 Tax=Microdochium trichocladiopsis TaxID=1682393 RepID=A0A9P9BU73_9PEZI|nr:peptidase C65 Otubain-domain-containing protein [Microdochium trichocladiopsis]KAH7037169.1 peptidase C65 Otubain-domain-containing protein [Microdochium trichocladiopsis]
MMSSSLGLPMGPLIGDAVSTHAIAAEYAGADAIYVKKTTSLSQTYTHYRPVLGDGNCGWRAIGFAYFEQLIRRGDRDQIQNEFNRVTGLNDYIETVGGHDRWLFEDMVSESLDLLQEILVSITQGQDAMGVLMGKINDPAISAAIVYHLRLLASSWLKANAVEVEPFLGGTTITSYIESTVLPVNVEIDHFGIKGLVDVLLKPANMVLEIVYLDLSPGDTVNVHRMPEEAHGQDSLGLVLRLLYRPDHYDILYSQDPIPAQAIGVQSTDLQVNRATSFTQHQPIQGTIPLQEYATMDMSTLAMIPGFDPSGLSMMPAQTSSTTLAGSFAPSPVSWVSSPYVETVPETPATALPQELGFPQQHSAKPMTIHPLRFSKYNFSGLANTNEGSPPQEPTFTTSLFKNSHFNTAHYSNNNFQPEMYSPESEEVPRMKNGSRRKSP